MEADGEPRAAFQVRELAGPNIMAFQCVSKQLGIDPNDIGEPEALAALSITLAKEFDEVIEFYNADDARLELEYKQRDQVKAELEDMINLGMYIAKVWAPGSYLGIIKAKPFKGLERMEEAQELLKNNKSTAPSPVMILARDIAPVVPYILAARSPPLPRPHTLRARPRAPPRDGWLGRLSPARGARAAARGAGDGRGASGWSMHKNKAVLHEDGPRHRREGRQGGAQPGARADGHRYARGEGVPRHAPGPCPS